MTMNATSETFRPAFPDHDHPNITYGLSFTEACGNHVESTFNASRVYIISSGSLARNTEALANLRLALGSKIVGTRIGMKSHTLWSEILEIINEARDVKVDLLITLGAGSLTDGAKIIALGLANGVSTFEELEALASDSPNKKEHIKSPEVPIISIPTSLSGGEYSDLGGGTNDKTRRKHLFSTPCKGPALVVLDAELTKTTPASVWLSTGIRAVDHCVETICSLQGNAKADKDAEAGLKLLVHGLLKSKLDGQDLEARHQCQMGVIEAMKAVGDGVPMGASHGIGHQLGPLGVGHGETSCILLPAVCKYNADHGTNVDKQQKVVDILWKDQEVKSALQQRGLTEGKADLGDVLDAVIKELGMPRKLKDVHVGRDKLDDLAANSLHDPWCATNPVPLKKKEQVLEILEMVLG